jgi:ankyrin repeat protein
LRKLAAAGAKLDARADDGAGVLGNAVRSLDAETIRAAIETGAAVDQPDRDGKTALMIAARLGDLAMIELFLRLGADPNKRGDPPGVTALMLAANNAHREAVERLLAAGADPNAKADDGWDAVRAAEDVGEDDIAALLRARQRRR